MDKTLLKWGDPHSSDTPGSNNFTYGYLPAVASDAPTDALVNRFPALGFEYSCMS